MDAYWHIKDVFFVSIHRFFLKNATNYQRNSEFIHEFDIKAFLLWIQEY